MKFTEDINMTKYGINNLIRALSNKHKGKIVFIKHEQYYEKRRGLLDIIHYTVDGVFCRREIEHSHFIDIIVYESNL